MSNITPKANNLLINNLLSPKYTAEDIDRIQKFLEDYDTLKFYINKNWLYPAISTPQKKSVSGYMNTWIRDTIMATNYQREIGHYCLAKKTMTTLRDYFYKHRIRFLNIIEGKADKNDPMQRPHVRFNGETLEEIDQKWPHAQNDALGYALWMTFKLANEHRYKLTYRDYEVFSLFLPYFGAIEYWQDEDSGHWEEARKVESSSIGVVVAALKEMKKFMENNPFARSIHAGKDVTVDQVKHLIEFGERHLASVLPYESPPQRKADAALLFLIYPLEIVSEEQGREILKTILTHLEGEYGIKRYEGDSYWCANYKKLFEEVERTADFSERIELRNRMLIPGAEAQWCIFDPVISVIYAKQFYKTGKTKYFESQTYHFNRSLAHLTPEDFLLGGGKCAEAYYIEDSAKGIYVPNDHVPLAWTQANLGVAFKYMKYSCELINSKMQKMNKKCK